MTRRTLTATQAEQHALTMALVLAITAKTEGNSQRAVLVAGELAGRMQPLQVAQCQTEAKRILIDQKKCIVELEYRQSIAGYMRAVPVYVLVK